MHDSWLIRPKGRAASRVRLVCFPYAGGGASAFHAWHSALPEYVEVCAVQLPGRENRIAETPHDHLPSLLPPLVDALQSVLDPPFAIFGHSMGALIGFEFSRYVRRLYGLQPIQLFVSGHKAPQLTKPTPPPQEDAQLLEELARLDGTPAQVLENEELRRMVLSLMRADLSVCRTYDYSPDEPLDCGISAFGGLNDLEVSSTELAAWRAQTSDRFALRMVPGGHFFIREARRSVLEAVSWDLRRRLDDAERRTGGSKTSRRVTRGVHA